MVSRVRTVAFQGIEAVPVDVQVHDRAGQGRACRSSACPTRRWRKAASGCRRRCMPRACRCRPRSITVNLAPADLPKEGSHYDLPIALGLMAAIGAIPADALAGYVALGELGARRHASPPVAGVLPAAIGANAAGRGLICPAACGPEAAWAGDEIDIVAPRSLIALANHLRGYQLLARPEPERARAGRRPARPRRRQGPGEWPGARSKSPRPAATTC